MGQTDRLHALDSVRAFALILGIVLHATISFIPGIGVQGFPVADVSPSATLAITFYVIHIFRMMTFFLIAGLLARLAFHRKGLQGFIKDRTRRILLPLIVAWPICLASIVGVMLWALLRTNGGRLPEMAPGASVGFTFMHLWFVYYLLWMYVIVLVVRGLVDRFDRAGTLRHWIDRILKGTIGSHLSPLIFAIPVAVGLIGLDQWYVWTGIPSPDKSLIPEWTALVSFGVAFCVGWLLHRQLDLLRTWERTWPIYLVVGIGLSVLCLYLIQPYAPAEIAPDSARTLIYALAYGVAAWSFTPAIIGAGMRFFASESPVRRYLADSSYWLYLSHLPIVFALQAVVMKIPLHWTIKFPFILIVTYAVLMLAYHYWVRPTFIGAVLNGRKYSRSSGGLEAKVSPAVTGN